jgi:hypothetical protein
MKGGNNQRFQKYIEIHTTNPKVRFTNLHFNNLSISDLHQFSAINHQLPIAVVTFEPLGKRRKEFGEAEGRMATERAGASESTLTIKVPCD